MGAILAIVRKDLLLFFADRRALIMSFVAPIAIASFFGFIFSGPRDREASRVPIRVVDGDGSAISRAIVSGLAADKALAVSAGTADEAREEVRRGRTTVAVILPAGFGDAAGQAFFGGGAKPELTLLYDPSHATELAMVRGILTQHVMQAVSAEMFGGDQGRRLTQQSLDRLAAPGAAAMPEADRQALGDLLASVNRWYERAAASPAPGSSPAPAGAPAPRGLSMPYAVAEQAVTSAAGVAYNGFAHSFAGMGVQFLLFACIDLAVGMLVERQLGLWKRLRAAPLSRATLLGAKAASGAIISLLSLSVTFAFGMAVFGIRVDGSWPGFVGVCLATAVMASCFGLLIAALGKTPQAARGVATLAVLLMVMLGGAWVPSFVFPPWLQKLTLVVPARWAVDGLDAATWRGVDFAGVLPAILVLLAFAAVFGALAHARFRWEAD
jgi:linearmycin/streptolysin S transport system permease protein